MRSRTAHPWRGGHPLHAPRCAWRIESLHGWLVLGKFPRFCFCGCRWARGGCGNGAGGLPVAARREKMTVSHWLFAASCSALPVGTRSPPSSLNYLAMVPLTPSKSLLSTGSGLPLPHYVPIPSWPGSSGLRAQGQPQGLP